MPRQSLRRGRQKSFSPQGSCFQKWKACPDTLLNDFTTSDTLAWCACRCARTRGGSRPFRKVVSLRCEHTDTHKGPPPKERLRTCYTLPPHGFSQPPYSPGHHNLSAGAPALHRAPPPLRYGELRLWTRRARLRNEQTRPRARLRDANAHGGRLRGRC